MDGGWPLTGRGAELDSVIDTVVGAERAGVIIAGTAGVGKTRLAREAGAAMAARGWAVRHVAGTGPGRSISMGAFARWTAGVGASPLSSLRDVVTTLTGDAGDAQLLIIADDAHLLDDQSALVLHHLIIQRLASVVVTIRHDESTSDTLVALWKDDLVTRLDLNPLARPESDLLVQAALGGRVHADCLDRLWRLTLGNALFLRHLVEQEIATQRLGQTEGEWRWTEGTLASPSLVDLLRLQIGAVPDELCEVVDLVAVAEPIGWSCLTTMVDRRLVQDAARRGLIKVSPDDDMVYAGHPLYAEIRLEQCGPRRVRQLRTTVIKALLAEENGAGRDPLRLGLLWLDSDLAPDPDVFAMAAHCARSALNLGLAERFARAAHDADPSASTQMHLAYVLFMLEKGTETEQILAKFDTHGITGGFVNAVTLRAANQLWVLRKPQRSWQIIEDALHDGGPEPNGLRAFHAVQLALSARPAETVELINTVDYGRLEPFGEVLGRCAGTLALGDLGRVREAAECAVVGYSTVAREVDDTFRGTSLAETHAQTLLLAGSVDDAVAVALERYRQCVDMSGLTRSMALATVGMTELGRGDLTAAVEHLGSASAMIGNYGEISGIFYRFRISYTEALARAGKADSAIAEWELTRRSRHPAYAYLEPAYLRAAAWIAAVQGRASEARQMASQAAEFARSHGQKAREVMCLQAAVQLGDEGAADRLTALAGVVEGPRVQIAARYAEAVATGDAEGLAAASGEFERMGDRLAAADAAAQTAAIHRLCGRRGSALSSNARAQKLARDCGGAVSPALRAAQVALPLTQREHEVVVLVARGLSNRKIAEAMSLALRTVEGHVYRATVKAGVSGRSELSSLVDPGF